MKSIVKYIFCINSPRHAVKQRSALIDSKGKETVPKHCKLELESEKNVYAEWDKELYDKIRKDLLVSPYNAVKMTLKKKYADNTDDDSDSFKVYQENENKLYVTKSF